MAGKFELYKDAKSQYRFRLKAGNGEIIAVGEAYTSKAAALDGIDSVRRKRRRRDTGRPDHRLSAQAGIHMVPLDTAGAEGERPACGHAAQRQ
jgi:hypothetical protein